MTSNQSKSHKPKSPQESQHFLHQLFGGLNLTWPKVIILAAIMGIYTALMAMLVPDGNSFHDIAVTPEWWVLPAIFIIVNCKKPLDAALKVFVFFLISQPLVYLIQVPFHYMGWGLFNYYPYWFKITLLTFPAGFIGWYMKKDKWYSGLILASMTILLAYTGVSYIHSFNDTFPDHLITTIYCFGIIPIFVFGIFRQWQPRIITIVTTVIATAIFAMLTLSRTEPFETYRTGYDGADGAIVDYNFGTNPEVTYWSGTGKGNVEIINVDEGIYTIKLTGNMGSDYHFTVTDDTGTDYPFHYYFNKDQNTVILEPSPQGN